jgi:hypothetical protein
LTQARPHTSLGHLTRNEFVAQRQREQIVELLPDTQNMQTKLNEFGSSGWELVAVSMGNMTEPRLIFKK